MAKLKAQSLFEKAQPFAEYEDTHVYYFVEATKNYEVRACERSQLKKLEEVYTFARMEANNLLPLTSKWAAPTQFPVLKHKDRPQVFPHHEWERTSYSLGGNACAFISEMSYDELNDWLTYVFWDSSTEFLVKHGSPTTEDCKIWQRFIWDEKHLAMEQKENLIALIDDYLDPVL